VIQKIDHIAIAVSRLDDAIALYRDVLRLEYLGQEEIVDQKVRVAFFRIGESRIELLEPLGADSPIAAFLEKRGGGIHHVSMQVDDIGTQITELESRGIRMIDGQPRRGAHQTMIAFAHPRSFANTLIEFTQPGE